MLVPFLGGGASLLIVLESLGIFRKFRASPQVDRKRPGTGASELELFSLVTAAAEQHSTPALSLALALGEYRGLA